MIHLRLLVPHGLVDRVLHLLEAAPAVSSLVHMRGAAMKPEGDVILCDVAREDASIILGALKELDLHHHGSIAVEHVDSAISDVAMEAEKASVGLPSDAVVWEEVQARTEEDTELGLSFLAFMALATLLSSVAIMLDSPILLVGAMVVGPEFGPLAGLVVAVVHKRRDLATRSFVALAVGFPFAMTIACLATLGLRAVGSAPETIERREFTHFISHPDEFSVIVALLAGVVGILSLTSSKSSALVGVLVSVTTIPAAANAAVAVAYGDLDEWAGAAGQLVLNVVLIVLAGIVTLWRQRRFYLARRKRHLTEEYREAAGLPLGQSRSGSLVLPSYGEPARGAKQAADES